MPKTVIHALEVIEVGQHEGKRTPVAPGQIRVFFQKTKHRGTIAHTRERVQAGLRDHGFVIMAFQLIQPLQLEGMSPYPDHIPILKGNGDLRLFDATTVDEGPVGRP